MKKPPKKKALQKKSSKPAPTEEYAYGRKVKPKGPEAVIYDKVGANIKHIREATDLTQSDLADLLGCKYQGVLRIERNISYGKLFRIARICKILGVSLDEICTQDFTMGLGSQKFVVNKGVKKLSAKKKTRNGYSRDRQVNVHEDRYYERLGSTIQKLRREHGLSHSALGEKINLSKVTMIRTEKAIQHIQLHHAIAICRVFKISLDSFAGVQ